jgi:hypothetical protein
MRYVLIGIVLGIIFSSGTVSAEESPSAQCQTLANKFSENPDSLAMQELERLRFCVNQVLDHREQNLKGELLKGTIIESQSSSGSSSDTKPLVTPKRLEIIQ